MSVGLLLTWCPVVLTTSVVAWRLPLRRAAALSALCALFWVLVMQASMGPSPTEPGALVAILVGAVVVVAAGIWSACARDGSGETTAAAADSSHRLQTGATSRSDERFSEGNSFGTADESASTSGPDDFVRNLAHVVDHHEQWLERARSMTDPWPAFGEFVRWAIHQTLEGCHVRPYRLQESRDLLMPLTSAEPAGNSSPISARQGVLGHVVTTGRSCLPGDPTQGPLLNDLTEQSGESFAWCFGIGQGANRLGAVAVGTLPEWARRDQSKLRCVEKIVRHMWITLNEVCNHREAATREPVSGLPTHETFLASATNALEESYAQGEPVAVAVVTLEGMRGLLDQGEWDRSGRFIREVACLLQRTFRSDDQLGRMGDSRFLILLRRVDSALATLIVQQLAAKLIALVEEATPTGSIRVRCGLAGSGTAAPALEALVSRAMEQCHAARRANVCVATDMDSQIAEDRRPVVAAEQVGEHRLQTGATLTGATLTGATPTEATPRGDRKSPPDDRQSSAEISA